MQSKMRQLIAFILKAIANYWSPCPKQPSSSADKFTSEITDPVVTGSIGVDLQVKSLRSNLSAHSIAQRPMTSPQMPNEAL